MKQMTEILVKFMIEEESELKIKIIKLYHDVDCKTKLTIQVLYITLYRILSIKDNDNSINWICKYSIHTNTK